TDPSLGLRMVSKQGSEVDIAAAGWNSFTETK
ncbi:MAG: hypothetical protein RL138_1551, partial [Bacteroidota bacterium]